MKRVDYKLNTWYPLTDNEYWVEEYPDEFPNCNTIVTCLYQRFGNEIKTYQSCSIGWGTMAKDGCWYFMIIEKPKQNNKYMPKYKLEKPINGNQVFDTLERALTYINNNGFLGMQFIVVDDNENNGTYVVDKSKNRDNDNTIKLIHKKSDN